MPPRQPIAERFWPKVQKGPGCWLWQGAGGGRYKYKDTNYIRPGVIHWSQAEGLIPAHRAAWRLCIGEIPDGLFVLHHCDNPLCVNPKHLFLGTQSDNMHDMASKGRWGTSPRAIGVDNGKAKLNEDDVAEIRCSTETLRALGEQYGVRHGVIWSIKHRKTWKHVP